MAKTHKRTPKFKNLPRAAHGPKKIVQSITKQWVQKVLSSGLTHNSLGTLQGGATGQYYHFTAVEYGIFDIDVAADADSIAVDADGNITFANNVAVTGTLGVTGAAILSSTLNVVGAFTSPGIDDNASAELLQLTGDAATGSILLQSVLEATNSTTGALALAGGLAVAKKAFIGTDFQVGGNAVIVGDLTVQGTTITLDAETWIVEDKNITIGNVETPSDITADGGGITLLGDTNKTILWDNANDNWSINQDWNVVTGKGYKINNVSVLNATTLGSSVVNSSLTNVGILTELQVDNLNLNGNTISSTTGDINITPLAGEDVVIDSHWQFDGADLTALTDNNTIINAYAGKNITIEGVTFDDNVLTATTLAGTLSTAAQTNVTSLGTLTALQVDNINLNGAIISSTVDANLEINAYASKAVVIDGHWSFDAGALTALTDVNTVINAYTGKNITIESVTFDNNVATATTFAGDLNGTVNTATTGVTQSEDDNSTKIATTAYVDVAVKGRNSIINGNFDIWQRNTTFAAIANGAYSADRFKYIKVGVMAHTITRDSDVPTQAESGFKSNYSLKVDCTTIDASIAAGDSCSIEHAIEGYNYKQFEGNTATLSFWVKGTKTGIHCVSFRSSTGDRSYVVEYTINTTDTWEKKTITVTFDYSGGTWNYINGAGLIIHWTLAAGSSTQGTADAWQSSNITATSNQVNACDNTANNFFLSQVQFELGSVATDFEHEDIEITIAKCERYYEKSYNLTTAPGTNEQAGGFNFISRVADTSDFNTVIFKVKKRAVPTVTLYNWNTGTTGQIRNDVSGAGLAASVVAPGEGAFTMHPTVATTINHYYGFHWVANAEL